MSDEWIDWEGGHCPVWLGQLVEFRARDGLVGTARASQLIWKRSHKPLAVDIVAYRFVAPPAA